MPQLPNPRNLMILVRKRYFHLLSPQEGVSAWLQSPLLGMSPTSVGSSLLSSFFWLHLTSSHFTTLPEDDPSIAPRFLKSTLFFNYHPKCPTHQGDEWQKKKTNPQQNSCLISSKDVSPVGAVLTPRDFPSVSPWRAGKSTRHAMCLRWLLVDGPQLSLGN